MAKEKPLEEMSLEDLLAERERLAGERTQLRLRQRAIEEAIDLRERLAGLPPDTVKKLIQVSGGVGVEGGTN